MNAGSLSAQQVTASHADGRVLVVVYEMTDSGALCLSVHLTPDEADDLAHDLRDNSRLARRVPGQLELLEIAA